MRQRPVALIIGVGPALGAKVAHRFAKEGYDIGLMARNKKVLLAIEEELKIYKVDSLSVSVDVTNTVQLQEAIKEIKETLKSPSVLIYNVGTHYRMESILDLSADQLNKDLMIGCVSGLVALQEVIPDMLQEKSGTVLFTSATAALRGSKGLLGMATSKFAMRALAQSAAREFGPQGIHVAQVVIDGQIYAGPSKKGLPRDPNTYINPESIANTYWHLHCQEPTCWTHECDIRTSLESW